MDLYDRLFGEDDKAKEAKKEAASTVIKEAGDAVKDAVAEAKEPEAKAPENNVENKEAKPAQPEAQKPEEKKASESAPEIKWNATFQAAEKKADDTAKASEPVKASEPAKAPEAAISAAANLPPFKGDPMKVDDSDQRLFEQIDAFRKKAEQLSTLIQQKQSQVSSLEELVGVKEQQNQGLHDQIERMKSQSHEIEFELDQRINAIKESLSADISDLKEKFLTKADDANKPLIEKVESMDSSFGKMKDEVFDKVHTENLQAYRNLQTFIKENDKGDENRLAILTQVNKAHKGKFGFLIFLSLVNTAGLAFVILYLLGFIVF